jgi:hypothetical protein
MRGMSRRAFATVALVVPIALGATPQGAQPPAEPAKIQISVAPTSLSPGGRAELTLHLAPAAGVKVNRYPRIKLAVAALPGIVRGGDASVGNDTPPPVAEAAGNYFGDPIDPVRLALDVDSSAPKGHHDLAATVTYFYCVTASGFCAPSRTSVKIPIEVR